MSSTDDKNRLKNIEINLKGKTLLVYWYLLKSDSPVGVRAVQRGLNISSSSVAAHHLDKLKELSLVDKDSYGRYFLTEKVDVGVLQLFTKVGKFMLPRYSFYAAFYTTMLILYMVLSYGSIDIFALVFVLSGSFIFGYETLRIWRRRPL